jgi:predicted  nucleic acid-binding Zn-ribbon protein
MTNKENNSRGAPVDSSSEVEQLRARILDLETYIDGRKSRWDALTARLARERAVNDNLRTAVDVRDARVSGFARETARLERRIEGQRREIATLRDQLTRARGGAGGGHHRRSTPRDAEAKIILRAAYDKLASMRTEQNRLNGKIEEQNVYIDRLCGKLSELELERTATVATLRKQREIIDHVEAEIRARLTRVALSSRHPEQRRAIDASIRKLDQHRADICGDEAPDAVNVRGKFILLNPAGRSIEYDIGARMITIGRGDHNEIRIPRKSVSREHARLSPSRDGVLVEDLGSRNGIRVNNKRVARKCLRSGDVVAIGNLEFRFIASVVPFQRHSAS